MKKLIACLLALAFVFALAACNGENAPTAGETTAEEGVATTAWDGGETTLEETTIPDETTAEGNTTDPGNDATTQPDGSSSIAPGAVPTDTAGIIRYYNEALAKTPMQRTSYSRIMTKVTAHALLVINEENLQDDESIKAMGNVVERENRPSDLVPLNSGWVSGAQSELRGNTAILTIALRDYSLDPDFQARAGERGYVSTLDKPMVTTMVIDAAIILAGGLLREVEVTAASMGQSGGIYTVTIDIATGEIVDLRFRCTQFAEGRARCRVNIPLVPAWVNATVTLRADMASVYAPK